MIDAALRDALRDPDQLGRILSATITAVAADGTVTIDVGTGDMPGALVNAAYTPSLGDVVQVQRRDAQSWLVLCATRTANATTTTLTRSWGIPYNVLAATPAGASTGTLVVPAASTRSWRSVDGWSQPGVYQGTYGGSLWRGCYFYGAGAFGSIAGRTAVSLAIHLHRFHGAGAGGIGPGGPVQQVLVLHGNPTQPGGAPTLIGAAFPTGSLSDATPTGDFGLPVSWGQALIDGTAAGVGHYTTSTAFGAYSRCLSTAEDPLTGRLSLGWST